MFLADPLNLISAHCATLSFALTRLTLGFFVLFLLVLRVIKQWPDFETTLGWTMKADNKPMPYATFKELDDFFAPHNARLFDYLGEDFGWVPKVAPLSPSPASTAKP